MNGNSNSPARNFGFLLADNIIFFEGKEKNTMRNRIENSHDDYRNGFIARIPELELTKVSQYQPPPVPSKKVMLHIFQGVDTAAT